jgi:hypothetical protein
MQGRGCQHNAGMPLSFFTVEDGLITRLVEFWPEPYAAPANRAHLVEPIDPST